MTSRRFSDEDLTAYLDQEADAALVQAIEAALGSDELLRRRLDGLRLPNDALLSAFDAVLDEAPTMPEMPEPRRAPAAYLGWGSGLAACLALGLAVGWGAGSRTNADDWMDYVAAYQALYVNGTLAGVDQSRQDEAAQLTRLGQVLGRDLTAAQTDPVLDFRRGQVLGYDGKTLIQLAYLSPTGAPVALCVIKIDGAVDTNVQLDRLEEMAAAHWISDGHAFLLIGGNDDALIADAAARFVEAI